MNQRSCLRDICFGDGGWCVGDGDVLLYLLRVELCPRWLQKPASAHFFIFDIYII